MTCEVIRLFLTEKVEKTEVAQGSQNPEQSRHGEDLIKSSPEFGCGPQFFPLFMTRTIHRAARNHPSYVSIHPAPELSAYLLRHTIKAIPPNPDSASKSLHPAAILPGILRHRARPRTGKPGHGGAVHLHFFPHFRQLPRMPQSFLLDSR